MYYRRNPTIDYKRWMPVAYAAGAYVAYKAAQGGLFGLPLQSLTTGIGAAGSTISGATTNALELAYGKRVKSPNDAPNLTDGSAVSGPQRAPDTKGNLLPQPVDLNAYDAAVRGFAWDGVTVYTIGGPNEPSVPVGTASTVADALGAARRWFTG